MAVKLLLAEPNPDDPLMPNIAAEFRERPEEYLRKARESTTILDENIKPQTNRNVVENVVVEEIVSKKRSLFKKPEVQQPIEIEEPTTNATVPSKVPVVVVIDEDEFEELRPRKNSNNKTNI